MQSKAKSGEKVSAGLGKHEAGAAHAGAGGVYRVECHDAQGNLKWSEEMSNLVVNVGLKDMNDKYFTGVSYTAAWYLGLYGAGGSNNPAAGNTAASHAGWVEVTAYSNATRPACAFGAATTADPSVISNSASPAVFNINGTATVGGAFLISNNTKGGTTGTLFSAADFSAPGDRSVANGDTLSVTYSFNLDAV